MGIRKSKNYVTTIDFLCAGDIFELEKIRKTVSIINKGNNKKYYVKLQGRGPRKVNALADGRYSRGYDASLPLRHADRADVYVYER